MRTIVFIIGFVMHISLTIQAQTLKINEVDYDQPGTDNAEFIELVNASSSVIDLGLHTVVLVNGLSSTIYDTVALPSQSLNPGGIFVICGSAGMVINCDLVFPLASDIIQNGSPDAIAIRDNLSLNIIDAFSYEGSAAAPYVEGTGLPTAQSDNNTDPFLGISRYPDGYDTQSNSTDFIKACITPGMINTNVSTNCQNPVSVKENKVPGQRMYVFPNPAVSVVSFFGLPFSQSNWNVTFNNVTGKCVHKISVPASGRIINTNISSLQSGMYLVTAQSDDAPGFMGKLKLVVQR